MEYRNMILRYQPYVFHDRADPFPIRYVGCTVFTQRQQSESFPKWVVDPQAAGAETIIEYAVYYDYDIQHLYDLEHIWVAVDSAGGVVDCWSSFHGMRLRAAGVKEFCMNGTHPVLYSQPGKHAMLPAPELFLLHPQIVSCCQEEAGGGLLIPGMLADKLQTNEALDSRIKEYIQANFSFRPTMDFSWEPLRDSQFLSWRELKERIPQLVQEQIRIITETP